MTIIIIIIGYTRVEGPTFTAEAQREVGEEGTEEKGSDTAKATREGEKTPETFGCSKTQGSCQTEKSRRTKVTSSFTSWGG